MGLPEAKSGRVTWEEYLALEDPSGERWMYWDGELFAMAGATEAHDAIESNLHASIVVALADKPCRAYTGNRRFRALTANRSAYADASIVCGGHQPHPQDPTATTNPAVVFAAAAMLGHNPASNCSKVVFPIPLSPGITVHCASIPPRPRGPGTFALLAAHPIPPPALEPPSLKARSPRIGMNHPP